MNVSESPADSAPGQTGTHVRVVKHVKGIVVVNKLMMERLPEHCPGNPDQKDDNAERSPARRSGVHHFVTLHCFSKCSFASSGWPFCNRASPKKRSASG